MGFLHVVPDVVILFELDPSTFEQCWVTSVPPERNQKCLGTKDLTHPDGLFRRHVIRPINDSAPLRILTEYDENQDVCSFTIQPHAILDTNHLEQARHTFQPSLRSVVEGAATHVLRPGLTMRTTVSGHLAILFAGRTMRLAILGDEQDGVIKFQHLLPSSNRPPECPFLDPISGLLGCTSSEGDLFFYQQQ